MDLAKVFEMVTKYALNMLFTVKLFYGLMQLLKKVSKYFFLCMGLFVSVITFVSQE